MRLDVEQCVQQYIMNKIKPNFAEIGRRYGVDPRTVKRYYNLGLTPPEFITLSKNVAIKEGKVFSETIVEPSEKPQRKKPLSGLKPRQGFQPRLIGKKI